MDQRLLACHEMRAAILRPRTLVMTVIERTLFAVAHRVETRRVDAERHQVFLGGVGALLAESEVVRLGATLVAVTFDGHVAHAGSLERLRVRLERTLRFRA